MSKAILWLAVLGVVGYVGYMYFVDEGGATQSVNTVNGADHAPGPVGPDVPAEEGPGAPGDTSGRMHFDLGQFTEAGPKLVSEAAAKIDAGSDREASELLDLAARSFNKIGNTSRAIEIWNRITEEFPTTPAAAYAFYQVGTQVSDPKRQKEYFQKASSLAGTEGARLANEALARAQAAGGEAYQARERLIELYQDPSLSDADRRRIEDQMIELNKTLLFGKTQTPDTVLYKVNPGDTLSGIAKRHKVEVGIRKAMNNLKGSMIHVGQLLKISQGEWRLLIDKSRFVLLVMYDGSVVLRYNVAVGKDNQTPTGDFTIASKLPNPVYYKKTDDGKTVAIQPGHEENVLGTRWMGFAEPYTSYGIHGTTAPESIGTAASEGCIRMKNDRVEELFEWVPRGMNVTIQE